MYDIFTPYIGDITWMEQASCKGMPSAWWHPDHGMSAERKHEVKLAKQICSRCPVTAECLDYGMQTRSSGTYGGITLRIGRTQDRHKKKENNNA